MPVMKHELCELRGSGYFATFDFSNGYWQIPLDKISQGSQSFITTDGIFTHTKVLHGTTNSIVHFQSFLIDILCEELSLHVLLWLEDVLIYVSTREELLKIIVIFLNSASMTTSSNSRKTVSCIKLASRGVGGKFLKKA